MPEMAKQAALLGLIRKTGPRQTDKGEVFSEWQFDHLVNSERKLLEAVSYHLV